MNNYHNDYSATGNTSSSANSITQNISEFPMMYNDNDYLNDASAPLSFTEEELLELTKMEFTEDDSFQWQNIVGFMGETGGEVNVHYNAPVQDAILNDAESDLIPFPVYSDEVVNTEVNVHYNAPVQDAILNAESDLIPFPVYSNEVVNTNAESDLIPFPVYSNEVVNTEVNVHYNAPVQDAILNAESNLIPFPVYSNEVVSTEPGLIPVYSDDFPTTHNNQVESFPTPSKVNSHGQNDRRKEIKHWTKEEQQLLLLGLQKCGKGDWRGISRNYVKTRTPTQIASHAQKYFKHLDKKYEPGRKRRSSIHDTTLPDVLASVLVSAPVLVLASAPVPALLPIPSLNLLHISSLEMVSIPTPLPAAQTTVLGPSPALESISATLPDVQASGLGLSPPLTSVPTQTQAHVPVDENMATLLQGYSNEEGDMVNDNHIGNLEVDQDNHIVVDEWFTPDELLENC